MDENELADRFSRDVDALLDKKNQVYGELVSDEYNQTLDLARNLSMVDFSHTNRIKTVLRNQMQEKLRKENKMFNAKRQNKTRKLASFVLVAMMFILFMETGALNVAAKGLTDLVQRIWIGDFTWTQGTPSGDAPAERKPTRTVTIESRGDLWILHTSIGNFAGEVLSGHDPGVQQFGSVNAAQAIVHFDIRQPDYLPIGYKLQVVMVTPMDWVFQFYGVGNDGLVIAQASAGDVSKKREGHITAIGVGMLTDKQIEPVVMNNQTAGWVSGYGLIWETDGMSFTVGDPDLSREEIIKIAESLK